MYLFSALLSMGKGAAQAAALRRSLDDPYPDHILQRRHLVDDALVRRGAQVHDGVGVVPRDLLLRFSTLMPSRDSRVVMLASMAGTFLWIRHSRHTPLRSWLTAGRFTLLRMLPFSK